ncbi:alpha carbonic anhydrase 1, chloroplastic [Syzygium oleosum]|uniref:alpha carbonic anhydrase 1, chloroplastic n=1 Tax=Syzygium oleosum TaxID=219896 RepID=UPI0011D2805C|nr:alpha carbonic anhydrase 1, chloroplastic [Syzygium oleosum]
MPAPPASFPALAALLALLLASASGTDVHDIGEAQFTYEGPQGPSHWGDLSPKFAACARGQHQSPVNIVRNATVANKNLKALTRDYRPANATLVNNGFNIGVVYEEEVGMLLVDGKNYSFKQMHWHSPSEHHIDGIQFPAELHLVHKASDGNFAVVAILYRLGDPDPLISKIKGQLDQLAKEACGADEEAHIPLGIFNPKQIKRNTRKYYRYVGSLTTPPCTENVTWNVLGKVRSISKEQVASLKAPLAADDKTNFRPLQPLNGRQVQLYDELGNQ